MFLHVTLEEQEVRHGLWMSCLWQLSLRYNSSCLHVFDPTAELTPWFLNGHVQPLVIQNPVCCFSGFPRPILYVISLPAQNHFLPAFSYKRSCVMSVTIFSVSDCTQLLFTSVLLATWIFVFFHQNQDVKMQIPGRTFDQLNRDL